MDPHLNLVPPAATAAILLRMSPGGLDSRLITLKLKTTAESPSQQELASFSFCEGLLQPEMLNPLRAFAKTLQRLLECFMYFVVAKMQNIAPFLFFKDASTILLEKKK